MALWPFARRVKSGTASPSRWLVDWVRGGAESAAGIRVSPAEAMRQSAAFAAVAVLAQDVAKLPLQLFRRDDPAGRSITPVRDHPAAAIARGMVNPRQSSAEWRAQMQQHLCVRGNAYSWIERNARGAIVALWPLHPDRVQVLEAPDFELFYDIRRRAQDKTIRLPAREVLHLRDISEDGIVGMSRVAQMREALGRAIATERHGARLFKNAANPGGVLSHPGQLSDEARRNLSDSWQTKFSGENAHKTAILEEGVKYQQVGISAQDAQFIEQMEFSRAEIAAIWRVPPHKIGDLRRATFGNIEHQSLEYVTDALLSWLALWEPRLDHALLTESERQDHFFKFNVAGLLRGDIRARYQSYAVGRNWGWLSANDVRALEDMNPIADGDEYLKPGNMVGLGQEAPQLSASDTTATAPAAPATTASDAAQSGDGV